jgi:hypothetical protein
LYIRRLLKRLKCARAVARVMDTTRNRNDAI